jgi:hypothetical protein
MSALGRAGSDVKAIKDGADTDVEQGTAPPAKYGKSSQMTELSSRGSTATPSVSGSRREEPKSPLLNFNEPLGHTVDDDVEFEEKVFAHALAPLHLSPAKSDGNAADPWTAAWPDDGSGATGPSSIAAVAAAPTVTVAPQFDADFEEMMRRFGEEDSDKGQRITDLPPEPVLEQPAVPDAASPPSVLTYDAQTMLDDACGAQDDEDELLRSIEDIPAP